MADALIDAPLVALKLTSTPDTLLPLASTSCNNTLFPITPFAIALSLAIKEIRVQCGRILIGDKGRRG